MEWEREAEKLTPDEDLIFPGKVCRDTHIFTQFQKGMDLYCFHAMFTPQSKDNLLPLSPFLLLDE